MGLYIAGEYKRIDLCVQASLSFACNQGAAFKVINEWLNDWIDFAPF